MSVWKSSILEIKPSSLPAGDSAFNIACWDDWILSSLSLSPVNYMYFVLHTSITHSGNRKLKRCGAGYVDFRLPSQETRKFNKISYVVTNPIYIYLVKLTIKKYWFTNILILEWNILLLKFFQHLNHFCSLIFITVFKSQRILYNRKSIILTW